MEKTKVGFAATLPPGNSCASTWELLRFHLGISALPTAQTPEGLQPPAGNAAEIPPSPSAELRRIPRDPNSSCQDTWSTSSWTWGLAPSDNGIPNQSHQGLNSSLGFYIPQAFPWNGRFLGAGNGMELSITDTQGMLSSGSLALGSRSAPKSLFFPAFPYMLLSAGLI